MERGWRGRVEREGVMTSPGSERVRGSIQLKPYHDDDRLKIVTTTTMRMRW